MFFDLERSFDPNREAMIYRYATGNETNKMVIVYSFQTEECSHIVYEEYYPDTSEELPRYVDILGTIGSSLDVTCTHEKIYSEDTLMKFLDDGHVLIIHRLWYNYQNGMYVFDNIRVGHFYVLSGYVTIQGKTWFILHDPSNSDDDEAEATLMTYQKLRCGYDRTEDELRDDGFWCCAIVVNTEYSKNTISWKEPNG